MSRFGVSRTWAVRYRLALLAVLALQPVASTQGAMSAETTTPAAPRIQAVVDPRVELLSLVFRLAGRPEYNQPQSASDYGREVDEVFGPFRDHAVVKLAQTLSKERGISYDAVMSLAVHLTDVDTLGERVPFDLPPAALERRWNAESARAFVEELRDFVEVTGFRDFVAEHQDFYDRAAARLQAAVDELPVLAWFDGFFGPRKDTQFRAIVGLLNGPGNYGVRVVLADGSEEIDPVIGAETWDAEGLPVFGSGFEELLAHEFCHSYTNPVVDRHLDLLADTGAKLFAAKREVMQGQAYGNAESVLYETLVRACVGRYVLHTKGAEALQRYLDYNSGRGFVWTGALVEELGRYEADRKTYPDLDAFAPALAKRLARCVLDLAEQAKNTPKLVSVTPADGTQDLEEGPCELRIEFDRPMRPGSWSLCYTDKEFPEVEDLAFDAARRVFTCRMQLEAGHTYGFSINGPGNPGFASAEGVPLEPVAVSFTTRAK